MMKEASHISCELTIHNTTHTTNKKSTHREVSKKYVTLNNQ